MSQVYVAYDGVICRIKKMLKWNENRPTEKSTLAVAGIKLTPPETYKGSEDIETFEIFISKVLDWLEFNNLL